MLGPDGMSRVPDKVVQLMLQLQDWGIGRIARAISRAGVVTSSAEYILTALSEQSLLDRDFRMEIQKALNISGQELDRLFSEAAQASYIHDKRAFTEAGIPFTPYEDTYFMQQLTRGITDNTKGLMQNITNSMGFAVRTPTGLAFKPIAKFYQDELDTATFKIASGTQTFEGAIKEAVVKMADSGLRTVDYATGHMDRIDVAARRAVMSSMRDLTNRQSDYNAEVMGTTVFEMSWHGGHRPSHAWGGRRFDTTGERYPTEQELYERHTSPEGIIGTMYDYNCYHEKYAVFYDSPPAISDEELNRLEQQEQVEIEYRGKSYNAYDARQRQRYLERTMRRQKSLIAGFDGAGLADDLQNARIKLRGQQKEYRTFSSVMGLRTQPERVASYL